MSQLEIVRESEKIKLPLGELSEPFHRPILLWTRDRDARDDAVLFSVAVDKEHHVENEARKSLFFKRQRIIMPIRH